MEREIVTVKKKKRIIRNAGLVFLLIVIFFTYFSKTIYNFIIPQVLFDYPMSGTLMHTVNATGTINAVDIRKVYAAANMMVLSVNVKAGDFVEEGDVIAEIDAGDLDIQLKKKELDIWMTKTELEKYISGKGISDLEYSVGRAAKLVEEKEEYLATVKGLYESGLETYESFKNAQKALDDAREEYVRLTRTLDEKISENEETLKLKTVELEIKELEFLKLTESLPQDGLYKAPFAGTIKSISIKEGAQCAAGQLMFELVPADCRYTATFDVPEQQADILVEGDTVKLTLNDMDRTETAGMVSVKEYVSGAGLYRFTADVENKDQKLQDGMKVQVSASKKSSKYTCIVQNNSLHRVINKQGSIFVLEKRNGLFGEEYYAVRREITVLESDGQNSAIEGKIDKADLYIFYSTKALGDNMRVKIR